ncbi:MAG: tRNA synthetase class II (D K and N), partial [Candidatus Uhrbacteria bacterium GW2011_GWD2_52_7]
PEFTMLEWYRQGADYCELMQETGELIDRVAGLTGEWQRISYVDEFNNTFGFIPKDDFETRRGLLSCFHDFKVYPGPEDEPIHEKIDRLFQTIIWPNIKRSGKFMLCEFPIPCASLSKVSADGRYAERFEAFVGELELCNGFTELVDPNEQRRRFMLEAEERRLAGKEVFPIDEELLSRLASVASPTYGNALGVDRLVMLRARAQDIDTVHLFPPSERYS